MDHHHSELPRAWKLTLLLYNSFADCNFILLLLFGFWKTQTTWNKRAKCTISKYKLGRHLPLYPYQALSAKPTAIPVPADRGCAEARTPQRRQPVPPQPAGAVRPAVRSWERSRNRGHRQGPATLVPFLHAYRCGQEHELYVPLHVQELRTRIPPLCQEAFRAASPPALPFYLMATSACLTTAKGKGKKQTTPKLTDKHFQN